MPNEQKTKGSKFFFILILVAVFAVISFLFLKFNRSLKNDAAISIEQENEKSRLKSSPPEKYNSDQSDGIIYDNTETTHTSKKDEAGWQIESETGQLTYKQVATEISATHSSPIPTASLDRFFAHLDNQDYLKETLQGGNAKTFFEQMLVKLLNNPPKITRETDNLLSILQNAAHFYRVTGDKNIFIVKKIMAHEKELYEPVMADFYALICQKQECLERDYSIQLPLEKMYSYSVFFLNTLGGQAYLFRRDLTLRTLTKYYCILVLDQANEKGLNHLGVDIRYYLGTLIDEITSLDGLENQQKYVNKLYSLQDKYDRKYGN